MRNKIIFIVLLVLFFINVAYIVIKLSNKNNNEENTYRTIMIEQLKQQKHSLDSSIVSLTKTISGIKTTYTESKNTIINNYVLKDSTIYTLSTDSTIKLLSKFLSEKN